MFGCASNEDLNNDITADISTEVYSGSQIKIKYTENLEYKTVRAELKSKEKTIESYGAQQYKDYFYINRFLNTDIEFGNSYYIEMIFENDETQKLLTIPIDIQKSVIVNSFCVTKDCSSLTGNIVQNTLAKLKISMYKIAARKITYDFITPYESFSIDHEFTNSVDYDWLDNISFKSVPIEYSSYVGTVLITVEDANGEIAETALPFKVVRPLEIKHFGKHELAEVYEPVPVTGCIPGAIGNNVQYSESVSETRQNSVSITINNSFTNSNSLSSTSGQSEGLSVGETQSTILSSSLSQSETISESENVSSSNSESSNISYSTTDGENWSWSLGEAETNSSSNSSTNTINTGVDGRVTTGFTGEGSLPFLAKASGKVEVSAGVSAGWANSNTESNSESDTTSRGYSTGGVSQTGRTYGSVQNNVRSHSLTGTYILSSSTSNTITESSGLSSNRIWNMSESSTSGKVVSEANSESLAKTIVDSSTSSTTFSYSAYLPRGRYGIFFRQTSRYVKLSEIIKYNLDGFPSHGGFITMNSWSWAPEFSVKDSCEAAMQNNMPEAQCIIQPCGE